MAGRLIKSTKTAEPQRQAVAKSRFGFLSLGLKRKESIIPGFGLTLGGTVFFISVMILVPFGALLLRASEQSWKTFAAAAFSNRALAALELTFITALLGALLNAVLGTLVAWMLVRVRFPGRGLADALIDLPFALPAAVGGMALTTVFGANGPLGHALESIGITAVYSRLGVFIAVVFVGLPFVIRAVQPAIEALEPEQEEAALTLGARPWQSFRRVVLPQLLPAVLAGFSLSLARGLGEYGAVIFISGNIPFKTEYASLLLAVKLDEYDYAGATAIATVLLVGSFALLLGVNLLQARLFPHLARGGE